MMERGGVERRGGARPNAGRKKNDRKIPLMVRISPEAAERLERIKNKAEYIDTLIKQSPI